MIGVPKGITLHTTDLQRLKDFINSLGDSENGSNR